MELTVDLSALHPAVAQSVIKGLRHEDKAIHDLGVFEQLRLKQLADAVMAPGVNTEIGRTLMVLSPGQAQAARRLYGELCFADPDFSKFLLKHHPEFRVKDVGTRIQSGYTGKGDSRTSPRPSPHCFADSATRRGGGYE